MKNNKISFRLSPVFALATVAVVSSCDKDTPSAPDIVFILADDLGYGDVSCFNPDGKIPTPNIDRLASDGVMFTDAHATSALSTPSRYSVLTGRYPWRTEMKQGVLGGFSDSMIPEGRPTFASYLSDLGYETACIGKWHLGWHWQRGSDGQIDISKPISQGPTERGFDYFYGIAASLDMAPYLFVENSMATETDTRQMPKDKGPHLMHGGLAGANFVPEECLPELTRRAVATILGWKGSNKAHLLYMPLTAPHTPCLPTEEFKGRTGLGDYADFVVMMDDAVGQVIEAVRKAGRYDRTVFVFASDNGCASYAGIPDLEAVGHFPSYIYRGYKSDIFEGGHRIPLVISGVPAVDESMRGTMTERMVTLADLFATFVELAEAPSLETATDTAEDSFSLVPILKGEGDIHDCIVSVSGNGWFSIRERRYKLIFTPGSGGWTYPSTPEQCAGLPDCQLYDILNDPAESVNLISEPSLQDVVNRLTGTLQDYISSGRTSVGPVSSNDTDSLWKQSRPVFGK